MHAHRELTDRIATVRQERDRLITLQALGFEPLEQTTFGFNVVTTYKAEALRGSAFCGQAFAHDHLEPAFGARALVFGVDVDAVVFI